MGRFQKRRTGVADTLLKGYLGRLVAMQGSGCMSERNFGFWNEIIPEAGGEFIHKLAQDALSNPHHALGLPIGLRVGHTSHPMPDA